jgi:Tfp pilus assembly protein PilX
MAKTKLILGVGAALLVTLGVGWAWGASGRSAATRALEIAQLRDALLEGRAAVLDARLDVYSVNFGDASRHFEAARSALRAADTRLTGLGRQDDAKRLEIALARIDEAQRMAGLLNQDANALAADAAKTISVVIANTTAH